MKTIGLTVPDFFLLGEIGENQTKMSLFSGSIGNLP
jgi:hypothetical protein